MLSMLFLHVVQGPFSRGPYRAGRMPAGQLRKELAARIRGLQARQAANDFQSLHYVRRMAQRALE